jgi:hemoglobin
MQTTTPATGKTLYERIGGAPVVDRVVTSLYERVQRDPELAPFFANTPMDRQRHMQSEFIAVALGNESGMEAWDLARAHGGRGIASEHYVRFVRHLVDALSDIGVSMEDAVAVANRLAIVERDVTGEVD